MRTSKLSTSLALAALAVAGAGVPSPAAAHTTHRHTRAATVCKGERPTKLHFSRRLGKTSGILRWRAPARLAGRRGKDAPRYRVERNGRVVGQTTKRALRLRVRLDRTYRFAVVPLTAAGHRTRCGAALRQRVAYHPPAAPGYLAVSGDERGLRLTWQRSKRGDSAVSGYRVLRNGVTVGQTAATTRAMPAGPNRTYRFTVLAVDRHGRTSRPSKTVKAVTGHAAPTPPAAIQANAVSASQLGVSWQPSSVGSGRIVGYRVLRDGAVVKQVAATSVVLDNLAPSTSYGVSVVAIDNYGYMSAPATVAARTQDPTPTTGHAQAYLLATTDESFADFRAHYQQIGVVYPTYYDCTGAAALEGADDPLVTQWAQARKVRVLPRINCQRTTVVHRILTDPATRAQWLDRLVGLVAQVGYDGISIDFETGPATDRDALTSFITELAARLHAQGKQLTVAVSAKVKDIPDHPRSGIFDYPKLAQVADWVVVMAWGLHWSTSAPGAQDEVSWVKQVADYVATMPSKQRFVFGTNLYALDWPAGGGTSHPATAYQYGDIVPRLPALGATTQLDAASDNYHATYTDSAGVAHDVWYPDAVTTGRRIRLAAQTGFGGVAFWRLGNEDQRLWQDPQLAPGAGW